MCGIAGYIGNKRISQTKKSELFKLMQYRGPDSSGHKLIKNRKNFIHFFLQDSQLLHQKKIPINLTLIKIKH